MSDYHLTPDRVDSPTPVYADAPINSKPTAAWWNDTRDEILRVRADLARPGRPLRTIFFGDSITNSAPGTGHAGLTAWMSMGRLRALHPEAWSGVSGQATAGMLARVQADVVAKVPDLCVFMGGSNDAAGAVTLATYRANVIGILDALLDAGIRVLVLTPPPRVSQVTLINQYRAWLSQYCRDNGIACVDVHALLADPTTGLYAAGMATDGIHPSGAGYRVIAAAVRDAVAAMAPAQSPPLVSSKADATNILTNGVFIGDANADGVADDWFVQGGGSSTASIVAPAAGQSGNWQRVASVSGQRYLIQTVAASGKVAAGDRLLFGLRYRSGGQEAAGSGPLVHFSISGGTGHVFPAGGTVHGLSADVPDSYIVCEATVGTLPTSVGMDITFNAPGGWIEIAQATIRNLTALGLG